MCLMIIMLLPSFYLMVNHENTGKLGKDRDRWDDNVSYAGVSGRLRHFRAATI